MSVQAITWAFEQPISDPTSKFVLVALSNFATETGKTYVSSGTLCDMVSATRPTIRRALEILAALKDSDGEPVIKDTGQRVGSTGKIVVWQLPPRARFGMGKNLSHYNTHNVKGNTTQCERWQSRPYIGNPMEPNNSAGKPGAASPAKGGKQHRGKGEWVPVPKALQTQEFLGAWEGWLADRRERGKPVTQRAAEMQLAKCAAMGAEKAVVAVRASIERGYQGIFEQHNHTNGHQANRKPGADRNAGTTNAADTTDWSAVAAANVERRLNGASSGDKGQAKA